MTDCRHAYIKTCIIFLFVSQLKALKEQQACWESQRAELEQRAEDGEEKADKLEKYNTIDSMLYLYL